MSELTKIEELKMIDEVIPQKRYRALKRFSKNKPALISLIFMIFCIALCAFPSLISGYEQNSQLLAMLDNYLRVLIGWVQIFLVGTCLRNCYMQCK